MPSSTDRAEGGTERELVDDRRLNLLPGLLWKTYVHKLQHQTNNQSILASFPFSCLRLYTPKYRRGLRPATRHAVTSLLVLCWPLGRSPSCPLRTSAWLASSPLPRHHSHSALPDTAGHAQRPSPSYIARVPMTQNTRFPCPFLVVCLSPGAFATRAGALFCSLLSP